MYGLVGNGSVTTSADFQLPECTFFTFCIVTSIKCQHELISLDPLEFPVETCFASLQQMAYNLSESFPHCQCIFLYNFFPKKFAWWLKLHLSKKNWSGCGQAISALTATDSFKLWPSSSCNTACMDLPDPLLPSISIVRHSWEAFKVISCICTQLLYIGSR